MNLFLELCLLLWFTFKKERFQLHYFLIIITIILVLNAQTHPDRAKSCSELHLNEWYEWMTVFVLAAAQNIGTHNNVKKMPMEKFY